MCRGDWKGRSIGRNARLEPLPTAEQDSYLPSNSCLLYFSSIDYINRPSGRLYLAKDPYLLKIVLKTLNKLLTDNLPR
jgi:hypothetical protein